VPEVSSIICNHSLLASVEKSIIFPCLRIHHVHLGNFDGSYFWHHVEYY